MLWGLFSSGKRAHLGRELELVFWEVEELPGWELGSWAANILRGFSLELGVPDNCDASC